MVDWFCKIDDVEHGPLSQDELVKMAGQGRLAPNDLVRKATKDKWYKAGSVKGLFPDEKAEKAPDRGPRQTQEPAAGGTSAEAVRLLAGFGKKKQRSDDSPSSATEVSVRSRGDDWRPAQSALMQQVERKPLSGRTKRILWVAGAILLALVLYPPHSVPVGYSMPAGWYFTPIFSPPVVSIKADKGVGGLDADKIEIVEEKGVQTAYVKSNMPIHWTRLLMLAFGVIVVTAATLGLLAARDLGAEVPDAQPTHPKRRLQA